MSTLSLDERIVRSARRIAPKRTQSEKLGWGGRHALSWLPLKSFAKKYEIDVTEAEWPLDQYTNLYEFFTRKQRQRARVAL
jgi:phosphatidylserine decarboxylase